MSQLTMKLEAFFNSLDNKHNENNVLPVIPKAKKDWMSAPTYAEAREIYREKNGHYPAGFAQAEYFDDPRHKDERDRAYLGKMRRSR